MLVLHKIYAFFIRLFCLIIFPKTLSRRIRNFLLEFYFFRSIYSFLKLFIQGIRFNSVLVYEPNNSHTEVVMGYVKYLLELGFNVDVILAPGVKKWKALEGKEWNDVRIYYFSIYFAYLINKFINRYKKVLFTSVSVYRYDNTTINILNLFPKNLNKDKLFVVEHELKDLEKNNLLELEKKGHVITLGNFKKGICVNPHYFCKIDNHKKNKITKFICVGSIDTKRKNHNLLFSAIERLKSCGQNFIIYIVSGRILKGVPEEIKPYIKFCGRLNFPNMYKLLKEIDFYLPLLDPENPFHNRYITTGVTGSAQLIYGFLIPPVIHKKFTDFYGFNNNNSIIYENDLFDGMNKAISINENDYQIYKENLKNLVDIIENKSKNNLKEMLL